jgi:Transposase DDE domain
MARQKPRRRPVRRRTREATNAEAFGHLWAWFLPDARIFAKIRFHGNIKWSPVHLVGLVLCWAWSESRQLTGAFDEARKWVVQQSGSSLPGTYQGFMKALVGWSSALLVPLWGVLHRRMEQIGGRFWRYRDWVPIAFDGSRGSAPRTRSNEEAFCVAQGRGQTAKYRKKKTKGMRRRRNERARPQPPKPQAWITMMWHMGLRLPWSWRLGPSNASEREHVQEMLDGADFPERTLFCGDAGFVGYPLWERILGRGCDFLVRVGANVQLLAESADYRMEKRGRDRSVLCWPKATQASGRPPLRLRLIRMRLRKTRVWMLTSVLDRTRLTASQALRLYEMRWGIEVEFRGLKQTLDRAQLRSRNDRRLLVELDWSLLAMAVAELFALKEQLGQKRLPRHGDPNGSPPDPRWRSLASTMRALRGCLRDRHEIPAPGRDLASLLREALTDGYVRKRPKRARYRPPNPDKKPLGDPKVRPLDHEETKKLRGFSANTGR